MEWVRWFKASRLLLVFFLPRILPLPLHSTSKGKSNEQVRFGVNFFLLPRSDIKTEEKQEEGDDDDQEEEEERPLNPLLTYLTYFLKEREKISVFTIKPSQN